MPRDPLTVLRDLVQYHESAAAVWQANKSEKMAAKHAERAAALRWAVEQLEQRVAA